MKELFRRIEPYLTPLLAFSGLFFVSLIVLSLGLRALSVSPGNLILNHLVSLASAGFATVVCVFSFERGRWPLGLFVSPERAFRGLWQGAFVGIAVVGLTDLLIIVLSDLRHVRGGGIDWRILLLLILPAAFGEELVFRGYVLQKLYTVNKGWAVFVTSLLFAFAHGGNPAVGPVAFANILLAGVLLALMWVWDRSLWMPTWGHVAWNVTSGPVLGHELSGLDLGPSLFGQVDPGPAWLTGGAFGIEASAVLTLVELAAIVLLVRRIRSRERALSESAPPEASAIQPPDMMSGGSANQNDEVGCL